MNQMMLFRVVVVFVLLGFSEPDDLQAQIYGTETLRLMKQV
jgi:hypothetical protein